MARTIMVIGIAVVFTAIVLTLFWLPEICAWLKKRARKRRIMEAVRADPTGTVSITITADASKWLNLTSEVNAARLELERRQEFRVSRAMREWH